MLNLKDLKAMVNQLNSASISLLAILAALVSLLHTLPSYAQNSDTADQLSRYEKLQQSVAELESTRGYYTPALIEELVSLADSAAALNLHAESSSILERAIQIQRRNLGLFTADQIPLYFDRMEHDAFVGNWVAVDQSLDYLFWLLLETQAGAEESIIDNLIRLSEFHLLGVAGDVLQQQANHYRKAETLTFLALKLSENVWKLSDSRRLDLYYSLVKQFYLQSAAIERGGDTGYALRAVVPGSTWVRPKRVVQSRLYQAGLILFSEMRGIVADSSDNPAEPLAMIDLYRADWDLLFNQPQAETNYQEAFEALLDAGSDADDLKQFFSRPQTLPIPIFFDSLSRALAAAASSESFSQNSAGAETGNPMRFQDWFRSMPFVPFPATSPGLWQSLTADYTDTLLYFRLNSLEPVSRWARGTYRKRSGVVEEFDILGEAETGETETQPIGLDYLNWRLHFLYFRPHLVNGLARPYEGALVYRAAIE